jgi:hypothetical protein
MDIPDTAFWCVPRASIWVATRNPGTVTAELFGNGIGPWMNADNWLEEHKDELLPHYQGQFRANAPELARSPLDLASDEIIRAIRNDRLTLYDGDGDQIPETMLSRFLHVFEIRDWIEEERLYLQAKAVVTLWPVPERTLSDREQAARDFLKGWQVKTHTKDPYRGAWRAAVNHVAATCCVHCGNPYEAAKDSTGKFITEEIEFLRKSSSKAA